MKNNRRDFIKLAGIAGLGFTGVNVLPVQAEITGAESNILPEEVLRPFNRSPRMMQDHFEKKVGALEGNSTRRRASLKTKQDAENYILDVKSVIKYKFMRNGNQQILRRQTQICI